nr:immunoglobulin light chain junction region [Macaca mulatta]MOW36173.1 immunoglobulin light chain junction region [Macaca mulatta]MOW36578.1 immunoglobulin light chain junction region [Macaca mulatta]MOW36622.1 immunoglobulin light chain junction region [Macaca mulatta]MOW36788.1 immunoglobulin light chain junction region [Macaca mulatta]
DYYCQVSDSSAVFF